jgi:hypothetical protein
MMDRKDIWERREARKIWKKGGLDAMHGRRESGGERPSGSMRR